MRDISTRLPDMTDEELKTLNLNAQRLEQSGSASQKAAAVALLPLVTAEMAARTTAKLTTTKLTQARENGVPRKAPAGRKSAKPAPVVA